MRKFYLFLTIGILFTLFSTFQNCGCDDGVGKQTSTANVICLENSTSCSVSQNQDHRIDIDFGDVPVGGRKDEEVIIRVDGLAQINLDYPFEFQNGNQKNAFGYDTQAFKIDEESKKLIASNGDTSLYLSFVPPDTGDYEDVLIINTSADSQEHGKTLMIGLKGRGVKSSLEFTPPTLDFGQVSVGDTKTMDAQLTNTGNTDVTLGDVAVPSGSTGAQVFSVVSGPDNGDILQAGQSVTVSVQFAPQANQTYTGEVDAQSQDGAATALLSLKGEGISACMNLDPPSGIDFGYVQLNDSKTEHLKIYNSCNGDLYINDLSFTVDTPNDFQFDNFTPNLPIILPGYDPNNPQASEIDVPIKCTPATVGAVLDGNLRITSNDPLKQPYIDYPVRCKESSASCDNPDVDVTPNTYNFGNVNRGNEQSKDFIIRNVGCAPLVINSITISGTTEFRITRTLTQQEMTIPADPNVQRTITVQTKCGLPGTKTGYLEIYSNDPNSPEKIPLKVQCQPPQMDTQAIHIELTWDKNDTDVDLHFIRPGGAFCDGSNGSDCYYCEKNPEWGVRGVTEDNPFLDVDDIDGYGPENTNLAVVPYNGNYQVVIHYYSDHGNGNTNATVKIYFNGNLQGQWTRNLSNQQLWHVADIKWPDQQVVPVDQITGSRGCGCGF